MKKRFLLIVIATALLITSALFVTACGDTAPDPVEYTVSVFDSDGKTPMSDITVLFKQNGKTAGSAKTDSAGEAKIMLVPDTYDVMLEGLAADRTYTPVTLTATLCEHLFVIQSQQVTFSATVTSANGSPVADATVYWWKDGDIAAWAITDAQGKAQHVLDSGEYSLIVADLPANNVCNATYTTDALEENINVSLVSGTTTTHEVTVRTEGGLKITDRYVYVYGANSTTVPVTIGKTNANATYSFAWGEGNYTAQVEALPEGYSRLSASFDSQGKANIVPKATLIETAPEDGTQYALGYVFHDYEFTTPYNGANGKPVTYSIGELLKTKKAVILNNWGTKCTFCVDEMPAMNTAYNTVFDEETGAKYSDEIEILAVSNYVGGDSDATVVEFHDSKGYDFPMMRDTHDFTDKFGITGWPMTVVIDRYGVVAHLEKGAVLAADKWEELFKMFISDDYVQDFELGALESDSITITKPNVALDPDHYQQVAAALNKFENDGYTAIEYYGEEEYAYAWPFVLTTPKDAGLDENDQTRILCSSNTGVTNSMSFLYADVTVRAGKVLTFEYYADTATSDVLSVLWDGKVIREIKGKSNGWVKCHVYTDLTDGQHTLAMAFSKSNNPSEDIAEVEHDNVYIRNVHFEAVTDITEPTDMLRAAAYGGVNSAGTAFNNYATVQLNTTDGYYHVQRSSLQNAQYAGNDDSPLLFVSMSRATNWLSDSLSTLIYAQTDESTEEKPVYLLNTNLTINGVTKDWRKDLENYTSLASASRIDGYIPVDADLKELLVAIMGQIKPSGSANQWLEACYFYSHYNDGTPVGDPTVGLWEKTAIQIDANTQNPTAETTVATVHAVMDSNRAPFPITIYKFVPKTSGVYLFTSTITEEEAYADQNNPIMGQAWLYDDEHPLNEDKELRYSGGDTRDTLTGDNLHNFEIYHYLQANHTYYLATAVYLGGGEYDYVINYMGNSYTVITAAAVNSYLSDASENGNVGIGALNTDVEYYLGEDGYYHVRNNVAPNDDLLYLNTKYTSNVFPTKSFAQLAEMKLPRPEDGITPTDYDFFDLSRCFVYTPIDETQFRADVRNISGFTSKYGKYQNYTAQIQAYIAKADPETGLLKVDETLMKILNLLFEVRANGVYDYGNGTEIDTALENEWLRFCWYYRTYSESNP